MQGTADQDGTEESMTGNDAAEQADSTEVSVPEDGGYTVAARSFMQVHRLAVSSSLM